MMILFLLLWLFLVPLFGALFGAFAGFVVGLFFSDTVLGIFSQLGIHGVEMWQIGLFFGFVGGFFKATFSTKSS